MGLNRKYINTHPWKNIDIRDNYYYRVYLVENNKNIEMSISVQLDKVWLTYDLLDYIRSPKDSTILYSHFFVLKYKGALFEVIMKPEVDKRENIFKRTNEKCKIELSAEQSFSSIIYNKETGEVEQSYRILCTYIYNKNKSKWKNKDIMVMGGR